MATGTSPFIPLIPWITCIAVLAGIVVYLLRQQTSRKKAIEKLQSEIGRIRQENQQLTERLNLQEANLERERQETKQRIAELASEKARILQAYEEAQKVKADLQASLAAAEAKLPRIEQLTTELARLKEDYSTLQNEKNAIEKEAATLRTQMEEERKTALEKLQLLEQAEERLTKEFENLANRIFEEKQQKFNEVNKNSVEAILAPVRQQLTDFRKKVEEVYDQENKDRASLRAEIQLLKSLNERISADALNLTKALKGESKTRGTWGEMQLERLLEESGLVKGREYEVQVSLKSEDGRRQQPDVVVHLPEKKDVIIDAKVSLVAYERYHRAEDEEERQRQLRLHIASLRDHFKALSAKNYEDLLGVNSLDLVVMFVPIEPALLLALEHEPALFNEAFSLGILLVSPSTLMATLQIIHNIWRYEYQNRNALQIATEAGRLHDQFVLFVEALEKVGDQIKKAGEWYETAHKRLTSGKGNLVRRTHKLQILGAKAKKNLRPELLDAAATDDDELENTLLTTEQDTEEITT